MIHWDWIATFICAAFIWKGLDAIIHIIAHITYPFNQAIIRHTVSRYVPTAQPIVDNIIGYDETHVTKGTEK